MCIPWTQRTRRNRLFRRRTECADIVAPPPPVIPTAIWFDPGSGATFGMQLMQAYLARSGVAVSSQTFHEMFNQRTYWMSTTGTNCFVAEDSTLNTSFTVPNSGRLNCRFYFDTLLPQLTPLLMISTTSGRVITLALTNGTQLAAYTGTNQATGFATTQLGSTGTKTFSTGRTYRICLTWQTASTTSFTIKWFWNDDTTDPTTPATLDGTVTTGTLATMATLNLLELGLLANYSGGAATKIFASHIYADQGTDGTDIGDVRITPKLPAANSTNQFDTAIGLNPAQRWTNVDERPLNTANGWAQNAATTAVEAYQIQSAAQGDNDISSATVRAMLHWVWANAAVTGTPANVIANGNTYPVNLTTTPNLYSHLTTAPGYPSSALQIGLQNNSPHNDISLYECGVLFAYTP